MKPLPAGLSYVASYFACLPALPDDRIPTTIRNWNGDAVTVPRRYARALAEAGLVPTSTHEEQRT